MIQLTPAAPSHDPSMIRSLGKRDMIARLLFNLKVGVLEANDRRGCLVRGRAPAALHPNDPPELRDAACCSTGWTATAMPGARSSVPARAPGCAGP